MQLQEEFNSRWVSIIDGLLTNSLKLVRVREEETTKFSDHSPVCTKFKCVLQSPFLSATTIGTTNKSKLTGLNCPRMRSWTARQYVWSQSSPQTQRSQKSRTTGAGQSYVSVLHEEVVGVLDSDEEEDMLTHLHKEKHSVSRGKTDTDHMKLTQTINEHVTYTYKHHGNSRLLHLVTLLSERLYLQFQPSCLKYFFCACYNFWEGLTLLTSVRNWTTGVRLVQMMTIVVLATAD